MRNQIASPVTWIGGKARLLKYILPLLSPSKDESIYVEPFGGSGVVLLNKQPHPSETYNDTDGDLVNLFRVIRDPDGVVHLWWELINTPVSRQEFGDAQEAAKKGYSPEDAVKRAARFVILCRQRFGGGHSGMIGRDTIRSWGTSRDSNGLANGCVTRWLSTMLCLPNIHRRLATVVVDSQDAIRCIRQWDSPSTLFYCDPPYVGHEDYYKGGFDEEKHKELAQALNAADARVVLSYYPSPLVDELYPKARWNRIRINTYASTCGYSKRAPGGQPGKVKACQRRRELILTNFLPRNRRRL